MIASSPALWALAASISLVNATPALKFEFERRKTSGGMKFSADVPSLPSFSVGGGNAGTISSGNDYLYTVPVTMCGQPITVQLDTGSTGESSPSIVIDENNELTMDNRSVGQTTYTAQRSTDLQINNQAHVRYWRRIRLRC